MWARTVTCTVSYTHIKKGILEKLGKKKGLAGRKSDKKQMMVH